MFSVCEVEVSTTAAEIGRGWLALAGVCLSRGRVTGCAGGSELDGLGGSAAVYASSSALNGL